jgi:GAF domain-containing protein
MNTGALQLQFTPFLMPIIGAAVALTFLAAYAWRQERTAPGADVFIALIILSAWWCFTYAVELITVDPEVMLLWVKLEWISIALLPVTWLLFALHYAGYGDRANLRFVALIVIIPAINIFLAWTAPEQTLLYVNPGARDVGGFVVFETARGPAFYVHTVYSYLLLFIATLLIIRVWRRSAASQRKLALTVVAGALLPVVGNAIYLSALAADLPIYVDLTVPAFAFSAVFFAWGWFRLRLFELLPELREPTPGTGRLDVAIAVQRTAERTLNLVSLGLSILLFVALAPILTLLLDNPNASQALVAGYLLVYLLLLGVTVWRDGPYLPRAVGLTAVYLGLGALDLRFSGLSPVVGFYIIAFVALAATLLPGRLALVALAVSLVTYVGIAPTENLPLERNVYTFGYLLLSLAMTGGLMSVALVAARRDSRVLLRISRDLARELEAERQQLEARVAERTRALETSAAVSRQLSTILDQSRLVSEVVEQLRTAFGYYHVHVFLWNEAKGMLQMVGGTGEAGQAMLVMGHALRPDQGLVGRAYSTNSPVVVPNVDEEFDWLPNRLLPETRAEVAVPINYGDQVLGVLDAQDSTVGGLGPADSQLLQTIAGQLAVALRNARLVAHIQQEAEQAALINAINRKITQTTDINAAMNVALAELSRALETRGAAVHLEVTGGNGHDH